MYVVTDTDSCCDTCMCSYVLMFGTIMKPIPYYIPMVFLYHCNCKLTDIQLPVKSTSQWIVQCVSVHVVMCKCLVCICGHNTLVLWVQFNYFFDLCVKFLTANYLYSCCSLPLGLLISFDSQNTHICLPTLPLPI